MNPLETEQFRRLEELFHDLVDLDDEERSARLARIAREEADLHLRLIHLLKGDQAEGIGILASDGAATQAGYPPARSLPFDIGPYRLTRLVGEGGMASVYEAEQTEPVRRRVAVKLIKLGMDTQAVVSRFRSERQALALMDHPNIAHVYDAGATEDGKPYFAMEYVDGRPITKYADDERLSTAQRLELFMQLCDAVQHAHRRGIIHRDLKPSNVLVTAEGNQRQIKVIDFGIAKSTSETDFGHTFYTRAGDLLGTPEYMSPEQAGFGSGQIDTRTDVYALGVVLYELLVGELPIPVDRVRASGADEIRRAIREQDVPRPSTRVGSLADTRAEVADRRATSAGGLIRQLRGDLDWILLKALEKDPDRRYDSPAEMAADVRRHLANQPVLARPPTAAYRWRKFSRRHRVAVTLAAGFILAALLAVAGLVEGLRRSRAAERQARSEAFVTQQAFDFMGNLFQGAELRRTHGRNVSARDLVDRARQQLVDQTDLDPRVRAQLLTRIGALYADMDEVKESELLLEEALELLDDGQHSPAAQIAALEVLGGLLTQKGELDRARRMLSEALRIEIGLARPAIESRRIHLLTALGVNSRLAGRTEEAISTLARAYELSEELQGSHHVLTSRVAASFGNALRDGGRHQESLDVLEKAILDVRQALATDADGSRQLDLPSLLNNAAAAWVQFGDLGRATELFEEALEIRRSIYGPDRYEQHFMLINLGSLEARRGRFEIAIDHFEHARRIVEATVGTETPPMAVALYQLGVTERKRGSYAASRRYFEHALELSREVPPAAPFTTPVRLHLELARLERVAENRQSARRHLRAARANSVEAGDPDPLGTCLVYIENALLSVEEGGDAAAAYEEAEERCGTRWDEQRPLYVRAVYHARTGQATEAVELLRRCAAMGFRNSWPSLDPDLASLRGRPDFDAVVAELAP